MSLKELRSAQIKLLDYEKVVRFMNFRKLVLGDEMINLTHLKHELGKLYKFVGLILMLGEKNSLYGDLDGHDKV